MGGGAGGMGTLSGNVLSERFLADENFSALCTELTELLYTSGTAEEVLTTWTTALIEQASDLVSTHTIASESASTAAYFD